MSNFAEKAMDKIGLFLQFLTKQGVINRVYDIHGGPILDILKEEDPEDYLLSLFRFELTNEGFSFWIDLQYRWLDEIESKSGGAEKESSGK